MIGALPEGVNFAVLVAQHMPEKFTRTFAERMDRRSRLRVREAEHEDPIRAGDVFICPGMRCMEVFGSVDDPRLRVRHPLTSDRYVPSADRLFKSAAKTYGSKVIGVVLTGMADDGAKGSVAVREQGGHVIAESDENAVVFGMPRAVIEAGMANQVLPLGDVAQALLALDAIPLPH